MEIKKEYIKLKIVFYLMTVPSLIIVFFSDTYLFIKIALLIICLAYRLAISLWINLRIIEKDYKDLEDEL